jgi:hypothetical protein
LRVRRVDPAQITRLQAKIVELPVIETKAKKLIQHFPAQNKNTESDENNISSSSERREFSGF